MATRKTTPKANYHQQADTAHVIADIAAAAADTDLLAVAGKPKFAPQMVELTNNHADTAGTVVLTPEKGVDLTFTVKAGETKRIPLAIKKVEDSGTAGGTIELTAYWWDPYGSLDWNSEA
jgi:hypothetical protein